MPVYKSQQSRNQTPFHFGSSATLQGGSTPPAQRVPNSHQDEHKRPAVNRKRKADDSDDTSMPSKRPTPSFAQKPSHLLAKTPLHTRLHQCLQPYVQDAGMGFYVDGVAQITNTLAFVLRKRQCRKEEMINVEDLDIVLVQDKVESWPPLLDRYGYSLCVVEGVKAIVKGHIVHNRSAALDGLRNAAEKLAAAG